MKETIETTQGNFNPVFQYLKLFRSQFIYLGAIGLFVIVGAILIKVTGIHQDSFTKKKKFVLISDEFEKSLESSLRQTFISHFGFS
jgi:hypothetical protein